jgi:hypothetical protein
MGTREIGVGPRLLANQHKTVASYVSADGKAGTVQEESKSQQNKNLRKICRKKQVGVVRD